MFPPGITHLADMPYTLFDALQLGLKFLAMEDLPNDERPAREIWLEGDLMREHWARVTLARKDKYGTDDKNKIDRDIDGPAEENALMSEWGLHR